MIACKSIHMFQFINIIKCLLNPSWWQWRKTQTASGDRNVLFISRAWLMRERMMMMMMKMMMMMM